MTMKKKSTKIRWVRSRLIDGKLYRVLEDGRTGKEIKPRYDPIKANSPAAYAPDDDVPLLTMRELKQFKRVNPAPASTKAAAARQRNKPQDVAALRKTLRMSQAVFAEVFKLSVATVRDWESRRRKPDGPARVLLQVIAREPEAVKRALK